MTRLFYSILYAVTLAAACAIWSRHEENPALRDLIGVRHANAQSPDPFNPLAGDPAANNPIMNGGGMNGMSNSQNAANLNQLIISRPQVSEAVSRPAAWPGSAPAAPLPTTAPPVVDGLPGVSISSVPVIPGLGQAYSYNPKSRDGPNSESATAGRMLFNQPGAGPISPSQAAMAATSWSMAKELEGTKILARVGTEYILAADVLGPVNEILTRNADKIPPGQYDMIREQMIKQRLDGLIQTKMVLDEVRRKIPEEGYKKFSEKVGEQFDTVEVPKALAKSKLKTNKELDEELRQTGSSLEREKRAYVERQISAMWMHQQAKSDDEVTHAEMLKYYREHERQYEYPAKVRWEQIQVRFDRCPKGAAFRKLAEAGNHIIDGANFAAVAQSISQGPTASSGGLHDWTTKGSLVSEEIDRALFTLPPGKLSPILEDTKSFQIVRVVERKDAGRTPFTEAQAEIRRRIRGERSQVAIQKYVTELRNQVKVWTIFDEHESDDLVPAKHPAIASGAAAGKTVAQAPDQPPAQQPAGPSVAGPAMPPGNQITAPAAGAPPAYPATGAVPTIAQPNAPRYR